MNTTKPGFTLLLFLASMLTLAGCFDSGRQAGEDQLFEVVNFESTDGLRITADLYAGVDAAAPTVLLFHQAASSRGEFREIAPRLQRLGYNALAVDLRWGKEQNEVVNETARRHGTDKIMRQVESGEVTPWEIIDESYADMQSALRWLEETGYTGPRFVLGSSYSAMLVYRIGAEDSVAGVIALSPAEYDDDRPFMVRNWASQLEVPVLTMAAPSERRVTRLIADSVSSPGSFHFVARAGIHGASVLGADRVSREILLTFLAHHTGGPPIRREETVASADGLPIVLDTYDAPGDNRVVVLFHQGGGSARGEYGFLVPRLLRMGFDVVASDLYGGGDRFGFPNRTIETTPEPADFSYCDASTGVEAVLDFVKEWRPGAHSVIWGSSYSGALVLHAAGDRPTEIDKVLAFSPASGGPMAGCSAAEAATDVTIPALIVRPETEAAIPAVQEQLEAFRKQGHATYVASPGVHGSSTLNPIRVGAEVDEAWQVVSEFLKTERH